MATIKVDRDVLVDLARFKMNRLRAVIDEILHRWNEDSAHVFIDKARRGIHEEAENDAIEMRQLLLEERKLRDLLRRVQDSSTE